MERQAELWRRSLKGDTDAFTRIVSLHQPRVSATALSVALRADIADDVTQETFLVAWRTRETLRDPSKLSSWLRGIARNLAKKALRGPAREVGLDASPEPAVASPEDVLLEKERMAAVVDALDALSAEEREVLALYYGRESRFGVLPRFLGRRKPPRRSAFLVRAKVFGTRLRVFSLNSRRACVRGPQSRRRSSV